MADTSHLNPNDDNSHLVYIPAGVFAVICPLMVILRIWARLRSGGKLGADDWMSIVALVFALLLSGFLVAACQYGMGRHIVLLEPAAKYQTMKYFWLAQITYKAAINTTKVCILLLYLRIFNKIRWFRFACWAILGIVASYCFASVMVTIFQCTPIEKSFNRALPGHCVNNTKFWYANAGFSIATDIIILLLPMPLVYQLQVALAQKLALMFVFALGIFVVVTSCLRISTLDILATSPDTTYDIANVMWTIIEPNVAVVCACLPILRPLIVKLFPMLRSKAYGYSKYGTPSYGNKSKTQASQTRENNSHWVEIGGAKSEGIEMSTVQRSNSRAGSQDSILSGNKNHNQSNGGDGGIQKTVEYSIQYSRKQ